ncbi:MAG TPA: hypothetical protein VFZ59_27850 [Verrucomicrobiae bacterium]|nr:hypothetical protein [Verrucomicrobiae bacterium]
MTEIKFACPSCGQAIQCNLECANQNVPCPSCATLIRVPADAELTESPGPAPEENPFQSVEPKVSYADAEEHGQTQIDAPPPNPRPAPRIDNKPVSAIRDELGPAAPAAQPPDLRCTCPVCHSELRVSVTLKSNALADASVGDTRSQSVAFQHATEHLSAADREKRIAAAREANRVTSYPVIKPRLDKILSEESKKLEFVPPQRSNSAEEYQPEIDPAQIPRSHNSV